MSELKEHRVAVQKEEQRRRTKRTLKEAVETIKMLEKEVAAAYTLRNSKTTATIVPIERSSTSEATALVLASDWHAEEEIRSAEVNGLNSMNLGIAKKRAEIFFQKVVRLTNKERQDVKIHNLVLWLGGDFISGSLHDDNLQNALLAPMHAIAFVQELLDAGLTFLQNHGGFKTITIVCSSGNHSRITKKVSWAAHEGNSLEWMMYNNLAFRHPEINWVIDRSLLSYIKVYDLTLRFSHGHWCSHAGGVGSYYPVLLRKIYQFNQTRFADLSYLGHLHTWNPARRYAINGSLAGPNPFAFSFAAADIQPPIQHFGLIDKKRGATVQIPILL